jgi:hypothetical protein
MSDIADQFAHLQNRMLAHILRAEPRRVSQVDIRQAFDWSMIALGRDVISGDVPASAIEQRIAAAREANTAILRRQNTRALTALRRFWTV